MNNLEKRYLDLGESFDSSVISLRPSLRVNSIKISNEDFIKRMGAKDVSLEKISFTKNGFFFDAPFPLSSSEEYLLGLFYIQEAASMVPAEVLLSNMDLSIPNTSVSILDLCSAPGSKTTQLAQLTNNSIPILALDFVAPRLDILEFNLERMGASSVITMRKDGAFVDDIVHSFDYILVDAPCSGNFCVDKGFFQKRLVTDFNNRAIQQKKLLSSAFRVLKEGGTLVYSTCSLEPEEDELIIEWVLDTFDDISLLDADLKVGDPGLTNVFGKELNPEISKTRRFWPHKTGTEGFFIAKFTKTK